MAEPTAQPPATERRFTDLDWLDSSIYHAARQITVPTDCLETIIVALRGISAHLHATPAALTQGWTVADLLSDCRRYLVQARDLSRRDGHPHHHYWDSQIAPVVARIDAVLGTLGNEVQP